MKYIVYETRPRMEVMQIFCELVSDDHVARAERLGVLDSVISAGFLYFKDGEIICEGFSKSLSDKLGRDIKSRGEKDVKVFMMHNQVALSMRR